MERGEEATQLESSFSVPPTKGKNLQNQDSVIFTLIYLLTVECLVGLAIRLLTT